jgi:DNA-binding beta-propeller fold protein YncE
MKAILLLTLLFLNRLPLLAAEPPPLKLVQTIPLPDVKGRFDHFSIDTKGQRLYAAALGNNTLEVIDLASCKRLKSIAGMSKPQGVLYHPAASHILVANGDDGTLKTLDATTFSLKNDLPGLPDADNVRLDSHSDVAWVGYGDGALAEVTPGGDKLLSTIKLPGHPESFQLEKSGSRIFVNIPNAKQIAVINAKNHQLIAKWPMETFQANFPMALDEPNQRLFVGCRKPARLVIIDTETGKPIQDLDISADTDDLFYDAKRGRVYISCGQATIDTIGEESPGVFKPLPKIQTASGARTCFFSQELDRLYLAVPERGNQKAEIRIFKPQ